MGAPHHELRIGFGQPVEVLVESGLAKEDDAVGAAGHRRADKVVVGRCRDVADGEVAIAGAGRFADAGDQLEKEGVGER